MRFFLLMALFGVASVAIEGTWLASFPTEALRFDLLLVAVAAVAFSFEWRKAISVIILYGLLMDLASSGPLGMSVISYLAAYAFIRAIIVKISFQEGLGLFFWVAVVSVADKLVSAAIFLAVAGDAAMAKAFIAHAPMQALLDATVGLCLVPFLRWYWDLSWERMTRPKGLVMK